MTYDPALGREEERRRGNILPEEVLCFSMPMTLFPWNPLARSNTALVTGWRQVTTGNLPQREENTNDGGQWFDLRRKHQSEAHLYWRWLRAKRLRLSSRTDCGTTNTEG